MSYLTYKEYTGLGFKKISDEKAFAELEPYAERQLNRVTADYYMRHSLNEDTFEYRVQKFKTAMAIQIEYLQSIGGTVSLAEMLNQSPASVSIGRMRIEQNNSIGAGTYGKTMVANEAYAELIYTGLLYRGVTSR